MLMPDFPVTGKPDPSMKGKRKVTIEALLAIWVAHLKQKWPLMSKKVVILKDYIASKDADDLKRYELALSNPVGFKASCKSKMRDLDSLLPKLWRFSYYAQSVLKDEIDTNNCELFRDFVDGCMDSNKKKSKVEDEDMDEADNGNDLGAILSAEERKALPKNVRDQGTWVHDHYNQVLDVENLSSDVLVERFKLLADHKAVNCAAEGLHPQA